MLHSKLPDSSPHRRGRLKPLGTIAARYFFFWLPRDHENTISISFHARSVTGMINLVLTDRFTKNVQTLVAAEKSVSNEDVVFLHVRPRECAPTSALLMLLFICAFNSAKHLRGNVPNQISFTL